MGQTIVSNGDKIIASFMNAENIVLSYNMSWTIFMPVYKKIITTVPALDNHMDGMIQLLINHVVNVRLQKAYETAIEILEIVEQQKKLG